MACEDCSRRGFLQKLAAGSVLLPALAAQGCAWMEREARICRLIELQQTGWATGELAGDAVYIRLLPENKLLALSLLCTHKACTVKYRPEEKDFLCPCHKGKYDADGKVLSGKPPAPLHRLPAELRINPENGEQEVWVLRQRED